MRLKLLGLLQAVVVISISLYLILFMPQILIQPQAEVRTPRPLELITTPARNVTCDQIEANVFQGEKLRSGTFSFTIYRYDKLRQCDPVVEPSEKINDEGEYAYFSNTDNYTLDDIPVWFNTKHDYCSGCFVVYGFGMQVVSLKDISINPQFCRGKVGGEDIEDVINQKEETEHLVFDKGYFVVETEEDIYVAEQLSGDLRMLYEALVTKDSAFVPFHRRRRPDMVGIALVRHEYANFYHTTMSWYDIFLIMVLFKIKPYQVEVIWLDAHPSSKLDVSWEVLFGKPMRGGGLTSTLKYRTMIWNGFGPKSPINQHKAGFLPFSDAFRHFVLSRFELADDHVKNCNELRITVIWRRDYVAHPRNPTGHVSRKIANEEEVWEAIKEADVQAVVNGVQLDRLSMEEQLELITKTDILIGMHGAGLTNILYLPKTSGVIELFPSYMSPGNSHFRSMARWRRLRYALWANGDKSLEAKGHSTKIPKLLTQDVVRAMIENICNSKSKQ